MSVPVISAIRWENRLFAFLRREMAPSPLRWRASIRLCVSAVLATALVTAWHIPDGAYLVLVIFMVAGTDAYASVRRAGERILCTLLGGAFGLVTLVLFVDKMWLLFPLQAAIMMVALFLTRTTTAPYATLLFAIAFIVAVPEFLVPLAGDLVEGVWRVILLASGAGLGTLVQLVWWREDPEELLLQEQARRLRLVEKVCDNAERGMRSAKDWQAHDDAALSADLREATGLAAQLDLLADAEAQHRWVRQRHTEQIKLITDVQLLILAALELAGAGRPPLPANDALSHLRIVREECARLRLAIEERRPPEPGGVKYVPPKHAQNSEALLAIDEMERVIATMPVSLAFLDASAGSGAAKREPVAERRFFTPECRLSNTEVIRFSLKGAFAASLCGVIYQSLNWPGLAVCVMTALGVAQSTFGSSLRLGVLRFCGALLAGLATLFVVTAITPNMVSLASLTIVTACLFFPCAWICTGGGRISPVGLQMAIIVSMVLIHGINPEVFATPARDKFIGVLLGVAVVGLVNRAIWPVFTRSALHEKFATLLHQMAQLQRLASSADGAAVRAQAFMIHRGVAAALALHEDLAFEPTESDAAAETERQIVLRAVNRLQDIFLGLRETARERLAIETSALPAPVSDAVRIVDQEIAARLDALATALEERSTHPGPSALDNAVMTFDAALNADERSESPDPAARVQLRHFSIHVRRLAASLSALDDDMHSVLDQLRPPESSNLASRNNLAQPSAV